MKLRALFILAFFFINSLELNDFFRTKTIVALSDFCSIFFFLSDRLSEVKNREDPRLFANHVG